MRHVQVSLAAQKGIFALVGFDTNPKYNCWRDNCEVLYILLNSNAKFQLATQALTLVIYDKHDRKRKFTFDEAVENGSSLNLTSATFCSRSAPRECFLYVLDVRGRP